MGSELRHRLAGLAVGLLFGLQAATQAFAWTYRWAPELGARCVRGPISPSMRPGRSSSGDTPSVRRPARPWRAVHPSSCSAAHLG